MMLQVLPTPSGQPSTASQLTGVSPTASLQEVLQLVTQKYGAAVASNFALWYSAAVKQDPQLTPLDGFTVYITGSTIATNLGTATSTLAGIPGAAAKGASSVYQDLLGGFNIGNWFIRIGEILLGLVLVGVGLARVTGAQNFISKAVQTKVPI